MNPAVMMAAMQAAGGFLEGIGGWQEKRTQWKGFEQQAKISDMDAVEVQKASEYEASQITLEGRQLRARQLVQQAKSGILTSGPTARLVRHETTSQSQRDAAFALDAGAKTASRLRMQAIYQRQMAAATKMQAIWGALGTYVGTGSKMASTMKQG